MENDSLGCMQYVVHEEQRIKHEQHTEQQRLCVLQICDLLSVRNMNKSKEGESSVGGD